MLLASVWIALVADGVWQTRREHRARSALGPVVLQAWQPSVAAGLAVLASTLAGALALERMTGRFVFRPGVAVVGLALATAGVVLHGWARRALGPMWSGVVQVRAQHVLVERGPYRLVRHPIYLAGLLTAAGTLLAHPSPAALCLAVGLSAGMLLKARLEERALRAALGARYTEYAARVPAFVPRPRRDGGG
ncbi:MAG TPA: isoprenylcysteine carboxylmethyltransferase family protein [Candidatus Binatia bacterium]|nr:isoprenylcysteine carboxylmethyltransferase family protein [Candidatus Binatia bacterium]